jgi:hypothetical protein
VGLVAGKTEHLDLIMEVGGLSEQFVTVIASPEEMYRRVDAVVQLRVIESLGVSLKNGFPTTDIASQSWQ